MSTASEIVASLKIEADADLVAQLDRQLAKPAPTQSGEKENVKFLFVGDGNYITISGTHTTQSGTIKTEIVAEVGRATSLKKGSGVLWTTYVVQGLSGGYRLEFEAGTARLYEDGEQVWFWKGELEGLEGSIDIVFDSKALSRFANVVFPVS